MDHAKKSLIEESPFTPILKRITAFATGGIVIDGYILTIIGVALVQAGPDLNLDVYWSGMVGAAALVGILAGGLIFGYVTDLVGRRVMYTIDLTAILVFSIAQMFVQNGLELAVCRFLIGVAIGADYPIASALLAEFTPKKYRGLMLGMLSPGWYVGAGIASVVGYFLLTLGPHTWRWMLGSSAILAAIMLIGRWDTPESPRWLMSKGRVAEARQVVKRVWGKDADIEDLQEIDNVKTRVSKLVQKVYLKRLIFVCSFWALQVIPCFALYTFGPQILSAFHLSEGNSWIWGYMTLNAFFLIGSLSALHWVESIGRRSLIIRCFAFMSLPLFILGIHPLVPPLVVVACFALYAFASGGPGVLDGIYPTELFPTDIRATAYGIATAVSRVGAAVGTYLLPVGLQKIGIGATMLIAAVLTLTGLIICIFMAPETRGKTLKEASAIDYTG
ncbi:transporter, major facilitator family protein [Desulfitobacterium hafniense DP7]|uniref:Transporter, major facilitator family protein n=1 Tax=Desulfitobacterium hafniense DP7 TaxID=537010 RepID=G9XGR5_DESHA|nr:MFS transporter [Desulfitobacterium hafniense]EHL09100.1 transporter, major facilitator family protein [Desulfitobacterium hafniense DP7]